MNFVLCSTEHIAIVYWIQFPIDFIADHTYTFFFSIRNIVFTTHVSWQSFWWFCILAVDFTESLAIPTVSRALKTLRLCSIKFISFAPYLLSDLWFRSGCFTYLWPSAKKPRSTWASIANLYMLRNTFIGTIASFDSPVFNLAPIWSLFDSLATCNVTLVMKNEI